MGRKKKLKAQAMALALNSPKISILSNQQSTTAIDVRAMFVSTVAGALVRNHPDLGGRDDKRIVDAAFRLGDLLTERYLNT